MAAGDTLPATCMHVELQCSFVCLWREIGVSAALGVYPVLFRVRVLGIQKKPQAERLGCCKAASVGG